MATKAVPERVRARTSHLDGARDVSLAHRRGGGGDVVQIALHVDEGLAELVAV